MADAGSPLEGAFATAAPAVSGDVEPATNVGLARSITGIVTVAPILSLMFVAWQLWDSLLGWNDIFVFLVMYVLSGLGVTVGFHRLFTHRAFKTTPAMRGLLAILGSVAIEGPVISWVADHRKHHRFSDREGDPHSPHVGRGAGVRGAIGGLIHAHIGWLFIHTHRGRRERYAPDLLADSVVSWVDRTFLVWALAGLAAAFGLGWLFGGTLRDGLTGLLWGGAVRMLVLHHVTYSINSLCHFLGRRRFDTSDQSRNLAWLAPLSLGEAWHNNHHAFPSSAAHGLRRWELDPSAAVIRMLERLGLAWDVVRVSPERQAAKLVVPPAA
jgi:stearoyl-CoA desaturase (delta-9 desaturase)